MLSVLALYKITVHSVVVDMMFWGGEEWDAGNGAGGGAGAWGEWGGGGFGCCNPVVTVSQEAGWTVQQPDRLMATW